MKFFENKRQRELEERKIASGEYGLKLEPYLALLILLPWDWMGCEGMGD